MLTHLLLLFLPPVLLPILPPHHHPHFLLLLCVAIIFFFFEVTLLIVPLMDAKCQPMLPGLGEELPGKADVLLLNTLGNCNLWKYQSTNATVQLLL